MTVLSTSSAGPVNGALIGIIVLDTGFERLPGDVAHAGTWPFPVRFRKVRGVRPADVIEGDPRQALAAFHSAINDLVALGVQAITTSCGFLAAVQHELSAYSPVPFLSSALLQIPLVERLLPAGQRVGIIVSDLDAFQDSLLLNIGARPGYPLAELPKEGIIRTNMRNNVTQVDGPAQEREALDVAATLTDRHPDVGAIICECANLPPIPPPWQDDVACRSMISSR
ncbi:hypothetical protein ABK905_13495 [Acerihabitans sp. KWT182]|uniref:Aspartate/glutamate racemase family protein n=1 Tax=Acerihabitans sp. KWT182 TaxID=3157919 RepID=A0AAU7Q466_9GAMM